MKPIHDPIDDEIVAALRSLERSATPPIGAQERLREKVLAEYDTPVNERTGGDGVEVIDLAGSSQGSVERHRTDRIAWLLVAAMVLIVFTTVAQLATKTTTETERNIDVADRDAGPVQLTPGTYRTDLLGVTVSFDVLDESWAIQERPGIITLSTESTSSSGETVLLLRPTGTSAELGAPTLEEAFSNDDSRFSVQRTPTMLAGNDATIWLVTVSNIGVKDGDCADYQTCIALFDRPSDVGLQSPGSNRVIEIPLTDGDPIVIIITGRSVAIDGATQDLLSSLELEAP